MFSWGSTNSGELGQGGLEVTHVSSPQPVSLPPSLEVANIAVGGRHTLLVTVTGEVYTCGNNDYGQLGREGSQTRLEVVTALGQYKIQEAACGADHCLAIDQWGSLFSWGSDRQGQLGHNQGMDTLRLPRLVKSLGTVRVTAVAAGLEHSAALTDAGSVYTWGGNTSGQLGLGDSKETRLVFTPRLVDCLGGIPLAGLACGGSHTMVVSCSGAIFSWGANGQGQLGLGDADSRSWPTQVTTLRNQKVKCLQAGQEHSVALTLDGGVFTWGSSACGQCGHGTENREMLPRKVMELMGTEVTMIAAGYRHTMAYVPSRNKLYAMGVGGSGQLGRGGSSNANLPQIVLSDWGGEEGKEENSIALIGAGGNTSWSMTIPSSSSQPTVDMRLTPPRLSLLTPSLLKQLDEMKEDQPIDPDLMQVIETVFTSLSCINGSLLLPSHHSCRGGNPGVDLALWREAYESIKNCSHDSIPSLAMAGLLGVINDLRPNPPDIETLRFYLSFPLHPAFTDPSNVIDLHQNFAEKCLSLQGAAWKVMTRWLSTSSPQWLTTIITNYKEAIIPLLQLDAPNPAQTKALSACLLFLRVLNRLNGENGYIVSYETFYIPKLRDFQDLSRAYVKYMVDMKNGVDISAGFYICNYPFIFDAAAKELLLRTDQQFSQQQAQQNAFFQFLIGGQGQSNLMLLVSRTNLVQDTITQLQMSSQEDLKKPLRVKFVDEEAEDAGGVTKEFFLLLLREILKPDYGMFLEYEETNTIWFRSQSFEEDSYFFLIGMLCGLAIYNFTIINLPFPLALYKKLLSGDNSFSLSDISELSPRLAKSLQDLLDYTEDDLEEVFCLNFSITESHFGEVISVPLKNNGEEINVTQENKADYVKLYIDYILNTSCTKPFEAFKKGFLRVIGGGVLDLFHPQELMGLVVGNQNYQWDELERNCTYKNGYTTDSATVLFFWQVFMELTEENKKKFLMFLTGSDRIPLRGMESVKIYIQKTEGTGHLPVAHTCFNLLDLPCYDTKEKLKFKLLQAIECNMGFGLV